jgi:nicotinamidase-related amidase
MSTADDAFFAERGFGQEIGFGRSPAVICVDFMNAFTDPAHPLGGDYASQLAATNGVLAAARRRGAPVYHTVVRYDDPRLLDAGLWRLKQTGSWRLRAGTADVELDRRLVVEDSDQIIVKKYASAFFGTDLLTRLVAAGTDTLVITGCTTSGCVRATAVDALQWGVRPMVVEDAVGDRSESAHRQSLFDLQQKYADVLTSAQVIARLREDEETAQERTSR